MALDTMPPDGWRLAGVFLIVFLLNVLPVFAPPTWTALSAFSVGAPDINPFALALTGAVAATSGRIVLAKLSRLVLRGKLLSEDSKRNIDEIRLKIETHRAVSTPVRRQLICSQFYPERRANCRSWRAPLSKLPQAFDEALLAGVPFADWAEEAAKIPNSAPLIGDSLEIGEQIGGLVVAGEIAALDFRRDLAPDRLAAA